ncbi:hypothetical protein HYPSUDRAFT_758457 [Hypholoma sublateritium FD-334 SS-4]|uniref:Uncharacterized protein n=1 Tax=Hypholoma sublateritium (strain FD-334 SS-4) TaxID=945553 RepID=A0A0D2MCB1_HYPSF|nr:hypothetical protein HYPSUDRAFT_758457 [Hypholoma sublateritium FD-334 SS-4]
MSSTAPPGVRNCPVGTGANQPPADGINTETSVEPNSNIHRGTHSVPSQPHRRRASASPGTIRPKSILLLIMHLGWGPCGTHASPPLSLSWARPIALGFSSHSSLLLLTSFHPKSSALRAPPAWQQGPAGSVHLLRGTLELCHPRSVPE